MNMPRGGTAATVPARVTETGAFSWPWDTSRGLAVIAGAAGGGGGGGGALCLEGLNFHGSGGGRGGRGGGGTTLLVGERLHVARGGSGGGGGGGGGIKDGEPLRGKDGAGCHFGLSDGGAGGRPSAAPDRIVAEGGDGGRGFPGETVVVELEDLTVGDALQIQVGEGGAGGAGGAGYEEGRGGTSGQNGHVLIVPLTERLR